MTELTEIIGEEDASLLAGHAISLRALLPVVERAIGLAAVRNLDGEETRELIDHHGSLQSAADILDRLATELDQTND